jgi:hypothetical protein
MNLSGRFSCSAIDVSLSILDGLNTPFSQHCATLLRSKKYAEYLDLEVKPSTYKDPKAFFDDYIAVSLLSKFPNFPLEVDREKVAIEKFLGSERTCSETFFRLRSLRNGGVSITSPLHTIFHSARVKISALLGPFNWDSVESDFGFGPGACIGLKNRQGDSYYKFGHLRPTTTEGNAVLAFTAIRRVPGWFYHLSQNSGAEPSISSLELVRGNRITTVPKNAKTDRVIAIEPMLNMFIQKGIGASLRRKLRKVGLNLNSQQLNQDLAREGSLDGSLATIDLSSASDTVSLCLVEDLLPSDWCDALKQCRSPIGILPSGESILYRKVSSMGNGYTFELESLIFWALASSTMSYLNERDRRLAVYGDDIIVPTRCAELLLEVLSFAGFTPNRDKTFTEGPFRESCGKHYFLGTDVTPLYIRNDVRTIERHLWLANSIRRLGFRLRGTGYGVDSRLLDGWGVSISRLPAMFKHPRVPLYISNGMDGPDSWLGGDFDECHPRKARFGLEGFEVKVLHRVYVKRLGHGIPQLLKSLFYGEKVGRGDDSDDDTRQKSLRITGKKLPGHIDALTGVSRGVGLDNIPLSRYKLRIIRSLIPQWGDTGPWVG